MDQNTSGPVIIIEDDMDDQDIMTDVFKDLGYPNKIFFFKNGNDALNHLNRTEVIPFLILSDINMPMMDGFQLRNKIKEDERLQMKCIPYLFFTTHPASKWSSMHIVHLRRAFLSSRIPLMN
jgi:CheY-like chemotaxis protein